MKRKQLHFSTYPNWIDNFGEKCLSDEYHAAYDRIEEVEERLGSFKKMVPDLKIALTCVTNYASDKELWLAMEDLANKE